MHKNFRGCSRILSLACQLSGLNVKAQIPTITEVKYACSCRGWGDSCRCAALKADNMTIGDKTLA